MAAKQFQPYTMEITKQLDLSEADDKAVAAFRDNPFGDEDAIMQMTIGPHLLQAERIILWARWRQFVQRISAGAQAGGVDSPVRTDEVTRRYRVQPG